MSLSFVAHKKDCEDVIANKHKYPQANRFYLIYTHTQGVPDMVKEFKRLHLLLFLHPSSVTFFVCFSLLQWHTVCEMRNSISLLHE